MQVDLTLLSTVLCTWAVFGPVLSVPLLTKGKRRSKVPPRFNVNRKTVRVIVVAVLVASWVGTAILTYFGHYPRLDLVLQHF